MPDLFKQIRELDEAMSSYTEEQRKALSVLANAGGKYIVPTPGTESRLNGMTAADIVSRISALATNFAEGAGPTKREMANGVGLNPKSSRDMAAIDRALPSVPELAYEPGRRSRYVRRLTGPQNGK